MGTLVINKLRLFADKKGLGATVPSPFHWHNIQSLVSLRFK
jgi:hypothetical protein